MNEECDHDYDKPVRKGLAYYVCPKCHKNITLELALLLTSDLEDHQITDEILEELINS